MRPCCSHDDTAAPAVTGPAATRRSWLRRGGAVIEWAIPITTLALVPKCPACVAAYLLVFTGIGLSLPAAAATRWTLIALSIAALTFLLLRAARRAFARPA